MSAKRTASRRIVPRLTTGSRPLLRHGAEPSLRALLNLPGSSHQFPIGSRVTCRTNGHAATEVCGSPFSTSSGRPGPIAYVRVHSRPSTNGKTSQPLYNSLDLFLKSTLTHVRLRRKSHSLSFSTNRTSRSRRQGDRMSEVPTSSLGSVERGALRRLLHLHATRDGEHEP